MATYAIMSKVQQPGLAAAVKAAYPDHICWTDGVMFVTTGDTPREIAGKVGVKNRVVSGAPPTAGYEGVVIIAVRPPYYGWTTTDLWDWLKSAFQKET